jgi:threonine dehydrogenase-like Zn-dependent dehydrogenase
MECLWLEEQKISVKNTPPPTPTKEEALIRLLLAGICRTDIEMLRGYHPFSGVPGHEFVGEVMHAPGDSSWEGKRVAGEINLSCGECPACRKGRPNHCEIRTVLGIVERNGVFAESFTLPLSNLHEVPKSVPDEAAVFTEPLAAACQILEQVRVRTTDVVLVIGAGKLGQLIARTLHRTGCALQVAAKHQRQKQILADCGIAAMEPSQVSRGYADLVVEASGTPEGLDLARQAVRPRGTIVLKSTYPGAKELDLSSWVVDEISLVGSRCGPFTPALRLLEKSLVDPIPLVEARYPLDKGDRAFEHAQRPGTLKVLLHPA